MKLLFLVSSLDLTQPFSATPAWWQLLKALYEEGVEVLAAPYQGPPIESLWWRALPNPTRLEGDIFNAARDVIRTLSGSTFRADLDRDPDKMTTAEQWVCKITQTLIVPRWKRSLGRTLERERDVDAVIFLTLPLNQLVGLPGYIRQRYGVPVIYYDGDVPASLPAFQGFSTGFRNYPGADLGEYDAFVCNSTDGAGMLEAMGARKAYTLHFGVDPDVYHPIDAEKSLDLFYFGHGAEYRAEWIQAMITGPSQKMPEARFAVRGKRLDDLGRAEMLPYLSFNKLREYVCRSRINLVITRMAHASVYGSSSSRPIELASIGACMVANPYNGIELWFEPEREIIVVDSEEEAIARYRWLLTHDAERERMGKAARARVLKEHTFRHRAARLKAIVQEVK